MNEEENQAIEFLKHSLYEYEEIDASVMEYIDKNHKIIYKLILKQQKEIEKLKDELKEERNFNKSVLKTLKECVHKDKIRKRIKEVEEQLKSIEIVKFHKDIKERLVILKYELEKLLGG